MYKTKYLICMIYYLIKMLRFLGIILRALEKILIKSRANFCKLDGRIKAELLNKNLKSRKGYTRNSCTELIAASGATRHQKPLKL